MPITHDDLIKVGAKWLKNQHSSGSDYNSPTHFRHSGCGVILTEFVSFEQSIPDVIGFNNHCSIVIECKISHTDYLADLKKPHRFHLNPKQCGNYRYYLTLPQIISPDEVENGWGLLYYDGKIHVIKPPTLHTEPEIKMAEYSILYSIARRAVVKNLLDELLKPEHTCIICGKSAIIYDLKFNFYCNRCYNKQYKGKINE
jgi:hypothetical protein